MAFGYAIARAIDPTKLDGATLSDFVFKIDVTFPELATVGNGGHVEHAQGFDIGVTSDDFLTPWDFRLISYNAATGHVVLHVRAPSVSHSVDTPYQLVYGDAGITTDQSTTATWPSSYRAAYPFRDLGGFLTSGEDATANANDGTTAGTPTADGVSLNGTTDNVLVPDDGTLSFLSNSPMRLAASVIKNGTSRADGVIHKFGTDFEYVFGWFSDDKLYAFVYDSGLGVLNGRTAPASVITTGVKQRVVMEWDGGNTPAAVKIFADGVQVDTADLGGGGAFPTFQMRDTAQDMYIGDGGTGLGGTFSGIIGDVFVSDTPISNWNIPEANAWLHPDTFSTGSTETPIGGVTIEGDATSAGSASSAATGTITNPAEEATTPQASGHAGRKGSRYVVHGVPTSYRRNFRVTSAGSASSAAVGTITVRGGDATSSGSASSQAVGAVSMPGTATAHASASVAAVGTVVQPWTIENDRLRAELQELRDEVFLLRHYDEFSELLGVG